MMSEKKIILLHKIRKEKEILFGTFSTTLTKYDKIGKWKEIALLAKNLGILNGKPWSYLRDTVWSNWRKRTLAKRLRFLSTNCNNGKTKLTDMDLLVLDILGKDLPSAKGLGDTPAMTQEDKFKMKEDPEDEFILMENPEDEFIAKEDPEDEFINKEVLVLNGNSLKNFISTEVSPPNDIPKRSKEANLRLISMDEKLGKKIDMELEHLQLQNYILRLQALELEQKLGLPRSIYTSVLPSIGQDLREIEN